MKFGPRRPSFKKMLAARASPKRFIRHSLGIKTPRGWGWLFSPKRTAYNRVYSRTTFSLIGLLLALFGVGKKKKRAAPAKPRQAAKPQVLVSSKTTIFHSSSQHTTTSSTSSKRK